MCKSYFSGTEWQRFQNLLINYPQIEFLCDQIIFDLNIHDQTFGR